MALKQQALRNQLETHLFLIYLLSLTDVIKVNNVILFTCYNRMALYFWFHGVYLENRSICGRTERAAGWGRTARIHLSSRLRWCWAVQTVGLRWCLCTQRSSRERTQTGRSTSPQQSAERRPEIWAEDVKWALPGAEPILLISNQCFE